MEACPLDKTALLIIDMQEHFAPCAAPLVPRLNALLKAARAAQMPVVWTQHGHPDPAKDVATSNLVRWWGPDNSIKYGSRAWQLLPGLNVDRAADAVVDEKQTYDAFTNTRLHALLELVDAKAVIVAGVMTELCCETTARAAFCRGFDVFFLSDGTGTDAASHHQATLRALKFGFAQVVTCEEAAAAIRKFAAAGGKTKGEVSAARAAVALGRRF